MKPRTSQDDVEKMISYIKDMGLDVMVNEGVDCTVLGLLGDTSRIDPDTLMLNRHVDRVMRIAEPFKKASKKFHPELQNSPTYPIRHKHWDTPTIFDHYSHLFSLQWHIVTVIDKPSPICSKIINISPFYSILLVLYKQF